MTGKCTFNQDDKCGFREGHPCCFSVLAQRVCTDYVPEVKFSTQQKRFLAQVECKMREYLKLHPGTKPDEMDKLIPGLMREVLNDQATMLEIVADRRHNPKGKAIAEGLAREVYTEIRGSQS